MRFEVTQKILVIVKIRRLKIYSETDHNMNNKQIF